MENHIEAYVNQSNIPGSRKQSILKNSQRPCPEARRQSVQTKDLDLDDVFVHELGQFGWFQFRNILLIAVPIIFSAFINEYVFSAAALDYRCAIPECDDPNNHIYDPEWIFNAIPEVSGGFSNCQRYSNVAGTNETNLSCPANIFDQNQQVNCNEYVYGTTNSVVYDFGLECNEWLRAMAGTLSSVGTLLVLPITGYVSDRFGRKAAVIISVFNLGVFGLIRAFSVNYAMYLAFQIVQTTLGAGAISSAYIFATESVGPKYRVITGATCNSVFATGQVVVGAVAWLVEPWRYFIIALHVPCFIIISYYWLLTESVRWMLSKHKYEEARKVLETIARVNKTSISKKSLEALLNPPSANFKADDEQRLGLIKAIWKSKILLRRVCTTPILWITTVFVYYGLSINSVGLSGNMYLNYILICAIEIPGNLTAVLLLDRIGRKATLSGAFFLSAICNFAFILIDSDMTTVRLILFLVGKFGISAVMTGNYLYTAELYPTEYRHNLLAFSSMVGRIGSITAPLTPALMIYWEGIPSLMFGLMACLSGLLVLTQPETLGTYLPNTLAEAEKLGTPESYKQRR